MLLLESAVGESTIRLDADSVWVKREGTAGWMRMSAICSFPFLLSQFSFALVACVCVYVYMLLMLAACRCIPFLLTINNRSTYQSPAVEFYSLFWKISMAIRVHEG